MFHCDAKYQFNAYFDTRWDRWLRYICHYVPLTFKFGPENSNVIMISTSFIVIGLFFFVFFGFVIPSLSDSGSFDSVLSNLTTLWVLIIYGIIGCALLILSYIASLQIFKRQEL